MERWLGGIGEKDPANLYPNVGALALRDKLDGGVLQVCSGVLISSQVFLTAGLCTAWAEPWREFFERSHRALEKVSLLVRLGRQSYWQKPARSAVTSILAFDQA